MQCCASRTRLALTEFLFFGDLKIFDLLHLLSLFRVLFDCDCDETVLFELMITCTGLWLTCFVILFLFSAVALAWLATSALKMLQAILCLKEMLGFDWIFVFWRPKNLDFLFLLSLSRVLFDCDCDEIVLFELMITCTGLWFTCFVILILSTWLFILPRLLSSGLLLLLSKLYAILCLKDTLGSEFLFFGDLKI